MAAIVIAWLPACTKSEGATLHTEDVFGTMCARCHGREGHGGLPTYDGGPAPRNFHDHAFQSTRTDEQLKETIRKGKGSAMPAFGAALNEAQITAVVTKIRSFDQR